MDRDNDRPDSYSGDTTTINIAPLEEDKTPKLLSLFSGPGGLDWGFHEAGFTTVLALDSDSSAVNTFNKNYVKPVAKQADLSELGTHGVLSLLENLIHPGASLGVIGGPPCQGFSQANRNPLDDDPRNSLPFIYLDIIEAVCKVYDVKFIVFENVLGIKSSKHNVTYEKILARIKELGFGLREMSLDASQFGVPQNRRRVLLIGMKNDVDDDIVSFLSTYDCGQVRTVRDTIDGLPAPVFYSKNLSPDDIPHHPNHWTMNPKSPKFKEISAASSGRSFRRLDWEKPSRTIAFGHREIHVHPEGSRRLSIYEAMLLQGFPETFQFTGTLSSQVTQVSNAVPPPMAKIIAVKILRSLNAND